MNATASAHSDIRDMSQEDDLMQHISNYHRMVNLEPQKQKPEYLSQEIG